MTREGAVEVNAATGKKKRISKRIRDADFVKTEAPQQPEQAAQTIPGGAASAPTADAPPLPHATGAEREQDTAAAERVLERIDGARTRKTSKKAARKAQAEATAKEKSSRLQFTDEERATPELEKYIRKSDKAADRLDAAKAAIPKEKKLVRERTFDEATGKGKTRLHFEEREKPIGKISPTITRYPAPHRKRVFSSTTRYIPLKRTIPALRGRTNPKNWQSAAQSTGRGKSRRATAATSSNPTGRRQRQRKRRSRRMWISSTTKPCMTIRRLRAIPFPASCRSSKSSGSMQRRQGKAAQKRRRKPQRTPARRQKDRRGNKKAIAFVGRHPAGVCIAVAALLLFIMVSAGLSSCGSMFSGLMNGILGTSYTSEDSDLVATENNYAAKENELQQQIDNIESTHPGYDEYRYDLDSIGHNPHELASYLTALLQTYTPQSAQAELNRVFAMQYTLTLTEETEIRYRTETSTDPETGETTTEEVPYEYHILNVKLTNKPISEIAEELLTPQQLEMYRVYLETSGNKPLIFGGGSPDMGASEDLSGVQLTNGTRPGNTAVVDLAKRQVGNVGGRPFWSWYGFNSRVEWCACFVSWCYNQAGKSEPRFAGCQSQGVPWFQSRGQWGARGYENIAPGDAIFFDWDGDGSADHVGLVIGTDGERVYTVEGNSGDACKIKSYPVNYGCIKGYGLMNWN